MDHQKIKKTIEELLNLMGLRFKTVSHKENSDSKHSRFDIESEDSHLLIGSEGENLQALNYVVKRIVSKTADPDAEAKFIVDVNGYHGKAEEVIKNKARIMSDRARSFKVDVELEPMSSYERMLIHSFLDGSPDIKTESKGEGSSRRVVIKFIGEKF